MTNQGNSPEWVVSVCSPHPLAAHVLRDAIENDDLPGFKIRLWTTAQGLLPERRDELLLLDGCCAEDWPELALRWRQNGGKVLVLLPAVSEHQSNQLRALFLGVSGVVITSSNWQKEVRQALQEILEGRLWIGREVLNEYVRRTSPQLRNRPDRICSDLTPREEQIVSLLLRGASNKAIGNALGIAERTVKYHVSNILQKSHVSSRKELLGAIG